jgi:hypothetical protein
MQVVAALRLVGTPLKESTMTAANTLLPAAPLACAVSGKFRLVVGTLLVVAAAELVGPAQFNVGPGKVVLLPMLWALLIGKR